MMNDVNVKKRISIKIFSQRRRGIYCKRPIQCLSSSKILTHPTPHRPACVCGGRTNSQGGKGVEGQYFGEDARHCSELYIRKYFVVKGVLTKWITALDNHSGSATFGSNREQMVRTCFSISEPDDLPLQVGVGGQQVVDPVPQDGRHRCTQSLS
jgi:hypothetical protein